MTQVGAPSACHALPHLSRESRGRSDRECSLHRTVTAAAEEAGPLPALPAGRIGTLGVHPSQPQATPAFRLARLEPPTQASRGSRGPSRARTGNGNEAVRSAGARTPGAPRGAQGTPARRRASRHLSLVRAASSRSSRGVSDRSERGGVSLSPERPDPQAARGALSAVNSAARFQRHAPLVPTAPTVPTRGAPGSQRAGADPCGDLGSGSPNKKQPASFLSRIHGVQSTFLRFRLHFSTMRTPQSKQALTT
ncbi:transmembrane protease serine 13-like [Choloepus didactylus]|uniref:transmembrane protease serine 13-like n=1 Tax=Choloepus didactylus TaxID=27675 RepID=UPI00189D76F3|nr:transmembrane protease serine 13-like [Choloepus didactylus]